MFRKTFSWRVAASLTLAIVGLASQVPAAGQDSWNASQWFYSNLIASTTSSTGSYYRSTSAPYVSCYIGEYSKQVSIQSDYYQQWDDDGVWAVEPTGYFSGGWRIIGTLGIFEDPQSPSYTATSRGHTHTGPDDFDLSSIDMATIHDSTWIDYLTVSASISNFGHASAQADGSMLGGGGGIGP